MKQKHVVNCQFSYWYKKFKNSTFRSIVIPLQKEFIDYLNQDGVVLPGSESENIQHESDSESDEWSSGEDCEAATAIAPEFPELIQSIENAIRELGGTVFPKLNWSAPRDAAWINFDGTLKCTCSSDVFILLKSSDRVSHDINHPFRKCEDGEDENFIESDGYTLILRKWITISSCSEFRCFVKKNQLIAISQRDTAAYYPYVADNYNTIHSAIKNFFVEKIMGKFPDDSYIFDIYINSNDAVKLVDFNPFGELTDPLLFTWDELSQINVGDQAEPYETLFRFVTSSNGVQPSPFLSSRVPRETLNLSSDDDINKMVDFLKSTDLINIGEDTN